MRAKSKILGVTQATAFAVAGFAIGVGITNTAHAQSLDFLKDIYDFIIGIVDSPLWALLPAVYGIVHLVLFAKTFQLPLLLRAIGGAAAAAIVVARWAIMTKWGVQH